MKIIIPPDFLQILEEKHLLLDTNVFIDAFLNPVEFAEFFNKLHDADVVLVSLDVVKAEFLKGAANQAKYEEKEKFFSEIVDALLPINNYIFESLYEIIKEYKETGKSLSITDLLLCAELEFYGKNLFLLTKNTTEFPTNIFKLESQFNISYTKGLHAYGVYSYGV